LPALGKAKTKAQGIGCLSNLKQMGLAWTMYAMDNNDKIAPTMGTTSQALPLRPPFIPRRGVPVGWNLTAPRTTPTCFFSSAATFSLFNQLSGVALSC
jgi:hypothetical protein